MTLKTSSYLNLGDKFYSFEKPTIENKFEMSLINQELAAFLNIDFFDQKNFSEIFSGKKCLQNNSENQISLCYAGHQFGHFVPQLGDGRAIMLGELTAKNNFNYDIQIKGSGRTKFSRRGDGFLTLEAAIREFLVSESLFYLNIETTRSLAIFKVDELIYRENLTQNLISRAILTRVAKSHIRVGTFEYFYFRNDLASIKKLADYCINRYYPTIENDQKKYQNFLLEVIKKQAELIAKWMSIGFIHGVMNTDNTSIAGETIDFGPCAFLDEFSFDKVFSSIDRNSRYAFFNQANIAKWNLASLADSLKFLFSENDKKNDEISNNLISEFDSFFNYFWRLEMGSKLGFSDFAQVENFDKLLKNLLELMDKNQVDFTVFFNQLTEFLASDNQEKIISLFDNSDDFKSWFETWKKLVFKNYKNNKAELWQKDVKEKIYQLMSKKNPKIIARNHQVKKAIDEVLINNNYDYLTKFHNALKKPFENSEENQIFKNPPKSSEKIYQTFCGT